MTATDRRNGILAQLQNSRKPVSATALAKQFSVSRQIVVGDIALLRAGGAQIAATPRGYVLQQEKSGLLHTIACVHDGEGIRQELYICVDNGCTVRNVIVEHPLYGQLAGELCLASRYDVDEFIRKSREEQAVPLSILTDGIHLHNLSCPDEQAYERVCRQLREAHILFEPENNME